MPKGKSTAILAFWARNKLVDIVPESRQTGGPIRAQGSTVCQRYMAVSVLSGGVGRGHPPGLRKLRRPHAGAAYARSENRIFLRGTGAGQPLGMINAGATIDVANGPRQPWPMSWELLGSP